MSVRKDSYVQIEAFMVNELKLSGCELIVYAIIYGFSQDGKSFFTGSHSYLAEWAGCTERSVWTYINKLIEKGFIEKRAKRDGSVKTCAYKALRPEAPAENSSHGKIFPRKNFHSPTENFSCETPSPTEKFSENILDDLNTSDTLVVGASAPTPEKAPKPAPEKSKRPALLDRNPKNDMERVEKLYLENYDALKQKGLMKTDKPVINWQQSRKLTKDALEKYGLDHILEAVRKSMDNDFCIQKGYSLTTILSSGVLSGLINGNDWHKGHAIDSVDHPIDMGDVLF